MVGSKAEGQGTSQLSQKTGDTEEMDKGQKQQDGDKRMEPRRHRGPNEAPSSWSLILKSFGLVTFTW